MTPPEYMALWRLLERLLDATERQARALEIIAGMPAKREPTGLDERGA